jgi:hypothetical protein
MTILGWVVVIGVTVVVLDVLFVLFVGGAAKRRGRHS